MNFKKYDKYIKAYSSWLSKRIKKLEHDISIYESYSGKDENLVPPVRDLKIVLGEVNQLITKDRDIEDMKKFLEKVSEVHQYSYHLIDVFGSILPKSRAKTVLLHEITLYPEYNKFKYINENVRFKIQKSMNEEKKVDVEFAKSIKRFSRYQKTFTVDKKKIIITTSIDVSVYSNINLSENFDHSDMNQIFELFFKTIIDTVKTHSNILLTSSCHLHFIFEASANANLMSFNPSISAVNYKHFKINLSRLSKTPFNYFEGGIVHEIIHAFDDHINSDLRLLMRTLFDISKNVYGDLAGYIFATFLSHARVEGLAKFNELERTNDLFIGIPNFIKSKNEMESSLPKMVKTPSIATDPREWGHCIYDLGHWIFFCISVHLLSLKKSDKKYFVCSLDNYFILKDYKGKHVLDNSIFNDVSGRKKLLKEIGVKYYELRDVKNYISSEDQLLKLRYDSEDLEYVHSKIQNRSLSDIFVLYLQAVKYLGLSKKQKIFDRRDSKRIIKLDLHLQSIKRDMKIAHLNKMKLI